MFAVRQHHHGGPDTLRVEEVPDPVVGPDQVRIRVATAGVHLVDTAIRQGTAGKFPMPELPMTPGREVAGVVDAVGDEVDRSWLGTRVTAHLGLVSGGYAELAVVAASSLHRLADHVSFEQAVTMIGTGRTAIGVLDVAGPLGPDDVVAVTSAAGALGALLLQAARTAGATTVGAAGGPAKVAAVRERGVDVVVDYRADGWVDDLTSALESRRLSVLFDGVGGSSGRGLFDLLGPGGRVILYGYASGSALPFDHTDVVDNALQVTWALGHRLSDLRTLERASLDALNAGTLIPPPATTFRLTNVADAHRALEARETTGKVVLVP